MKTLRTCLRFSTRPISWSEGSAGWDSRRNFQYMCWYCQICPMEESYYPERLSCLASRSAHYSESDQRSWMSLKTCLPIWFLLNAEMAPFWPLASWCSFKDTKNFLKTCPEGWSRSLRGSPSLPLLGFPLYFCMSPHSWTSWWTYPEERCSFYWWGRTWLPLKPLRFSTWCRCPHRKSCRCFVRSEQAWHCWGLREGGDTLFGRGVVCLAVRIWKAAGDIGRIGEHHWIKSYKNRIKGISNITHHQ